MSSCCPYTVKKQKQFDHIRLILLDRFSSCFNCQNNCCFVQLLMLTFLWATEISQIQDGVDGGALFWIILNHDIRLMKCTKTF